MVPAAVRGRALLPGAWLQLIRCSGKAPLTFLPLPVHALTFSAIVFADRDIFWHFLDHLVLDPSPESADRAAAMVVLERHLGCPPSLPLILQGGAELDIIVSAQLQEGGGISTLGRDSTPNKGHIRI
jgi:hypothetical protein